MHAGPEQLRERFVQRGAASFVAQLRDTKDSSDMLVSLILTKEVRFRGLVWGFRGNVGSWATPATCAGVALPGQRGGVACACKDVGD